MGIGDEDNSMCCCFRTPCWCIYILLWVGGVSLLVAGALIYGLAAIVFNVNWIEVYENWAISMMTLGGALVIAALVISALVCFGCINLSHFCDKEDRDAPVPPPFPSVGQQSYAPATKTTYPNPQYMEDSFMDTSAEPNPSFAASQNQYTTSVQQQYSVEQYGGQQSYSRQYSDAAV